jgi:hypothetical protein
MRNRSGALLALAISLAACDDTNTLDPNLVTYTDLADLFTFSVAGLENVSDATRYLWLMSGDQAFVDVSPSLSSGSAFLQIRGANGDVVYAEDIGAEVDALTEVNFGGIWQIDIVFEKASGSFGFTIERDTIP